MHRMVATYFPGNMSVVYAVSASSFGPAVAYLSDESNDRSQYLNDPHSSLPVIVVYAGYQDFVSLRTDYGGNYSLLFANGESVDANKAG